LYLGRPVRAAILFAVILGLFWSGVGIGGLFTVNPREEVWWWRAQMATGVSGMFSHWRQNLEYRDIEAAVSDKIPPLRTPTDRDTYARWLSHKQQAEDREMARRDLALVPPASDLAMVLSGVAGMLNLMCIFDAVLLSLMGRYGEPRRALPPAPPREEVTA
jgi:hypothetical protein